MTKEFHNKIECPMCRCRISAETQFSRWIRENPNLDSTKESITVCNFDYTILKYKTFVIEGRPKDYQFLMILEVKTNWSDMNASQRDVLYLVQQLIDNRKVTPATKDKGIHRHRDTTGPLTVVSPMNQKKISLRCFGVFKLRFSHTCPNDSKTITWNDKEVSIDQLESLLRFDIHPQTFKSMEKEYIRRHHKKKRQKQLQLSLPEVLQPVANQDNVHVN